MLNKYYASLLGARPAGTFELTNVLMEFMSEKQLHLLILKVNDIIADFNNKRKASIIPAFEFELKNGNLIEITIRREEQTSGPLMKVGQVTLASSIEPGNKWETLSLEGLNWASVAKKNYRKLTLRSVQNRIGDMSNILTPSRYLLLRSHMSLLERLTIGTHKDFSFDFNVTPNSVEIIAYEKGNVLTSILVTV